MLPVRGHVSGMLARPARSVKQTSTSPWVLETGAMGLGGGTNEANVTIADYVARRVPHLAGPGSISICDARCAGEKLPSVQKLPNDLAHPLSPSRFERLSAFSRSRKSLPEQRQLSRRGKFLGWRLRYQINASGEALAQQRLVGSLDLHALLDVIQRRCPPLVADLCAVGQFECFLPVSRRPRGHLDRPLCRIDLLDRALDGGIYV